MNKVKFFFLETFWWIGGMISWYTSIARLKVFEIKRRIISWQAIDTPQKQFAMALDVFLHLLGNELRRLNRQRIRELNKFATSPDFEKWATPIAVRGLIFKEHLTAFSELFVDKVKAIIFPNCTKISDTNLLRLQTELEWFSSRYIDEAVHNQETFFYHKFPQGIPEQTKNAEVAQMRSIHSDYSAILDALVKEANLVKRTEQRKQRIIYLGQILASLVVGYLLGVFT